MVVSAEPDPMAERGGAARAAGQLANAFMLGLVKLGGQRRPVFDAVLRAAISQSNQGHLLRDPQMNWRFAFLDTDPPDDMRRPVRVSALSLSLQAPLETVRRRVALQCREGVCLMTPDGVIVPTATTNSPPYRQALNAQWDMLQALYAHLLALGFLGPPSHAPRLKSEPAPVRLAGRYVVEFALRFTESYLRFLPSPVDVLISMEIHQLNAEHLPGAKGGTAGLGDFGSPSDAWRGPASTRRISEALGMPYETVRRHLERLVAEGHVRKQGRGYAPAAEVFTNPAYLQLLDENNAHLTHLFAALDHHGLAGVWAARSAGASGDTG